MKKICRLKKTHPAWGYRRVWAYLKFRENITVNKKRIYRLMKENNLLVKPNWRLKATRNNHRSKPRAARTNQFWGIDMTKIMVPSWGWMYFTVVIDWYTKKIVGYDLSPQSKAIDWLNALDMAVNRQFPDGVRNKTEPLHLISDNGSQPTSERFMKDCKSLKIKQIFTSYCNPKGNADTERVIRTMKEDLVWPREFESVNKLEKAISKWIIDYNEDYPHSSLGYMTPCEFEQKSNAA